MPRPLEYYYDIDLIECDDEVAEKRKALYESYCDLVSHSYIHLFSSSTDCCKLHCAWVLQYCMKRRVFGKWLPNALITEP